MSFGDASRPPPDKPRRSLVLRLLQLFRNASVLLLTSFTCASAVADAIETIAQDPRCVHAFSWIDRNAEWVTERHIHLAEIAAPGFGERPRGELLKQLFMESGLEVHTDQVGNVIGERAGSEPQSVILLMAHLDTVFPAGTDVTVRRTGNRLEAPSITDNGAGLAALVGVAQALSESRIATRKTILIAGDVGEEGLAACAVSAPWSIATVRGLRQSLSSTALPARASPRRALPPAGSR